MPEQPGYPVPSITDELSVHNLALPLWTHRTMVGDLHRVRSRHWPTEAEDLDALASDPACVYAADHRNQREVVIAPDGAAARVHLGDGQCNVMASAKTPERLDDLLDMIRAAVPVLDLPDTDHRVAVTFWTASPQGGGIQRSRMLDVPAWDAVASNYSAPVARELERTVGDDFRPGIGGQLLLWHGDPGTGKTWALRALAWEWRKWADLHYVTDPDAFFGRDAAYMLEVMLDSSEDAIPPDEPSKARDPRSEGGRWRLLVLEDTGEMMSADARDRAGQGLSRLLNVVDGMIGQGLRVLVLVTTNEKLQRLHPAVARHGRCAVNLEFDKLPIEAARDWLRQQGMSDEDARANVQGPMSVADLYPIAAGADATESRPKAEPVGFAQ